MEVLGKLLEAMVITLREGIEAALVMGILVAYLRKTDRAVLIRHAMLGLGAAVLASVGGAVLIQRYGVDPENELVEGSVMFVAAGLVGSLVLWMWRTGSSARHRLEHRLDAFVGDETSLTVSLRAAFGVFSFAFLMVLRVTRVAWLLAVIAGLVLVASSLGVAAAVTTGVLQRTGEIGLMKALGASGLRVASLFLSEAAAVGLAGGILGGVAGMMLARVIVRTAFGDSLPFAVIPMVISVAIGIGAASVASLVPVLRAAAIEPATVLRGE